MNVHHGVVEFSVKLVVIVAYALSMAAALGGCADVGHWTNGAIHSNAANFLTGIMRDDREAGKPP